MEDGMENFWKSQQTCINNCSWTSTIFQLFIEDLDKLLKKNHKFSIDWCKMERGKDGFWKSQKTCINNCSWTSTIFQLFNKGLAKFRKKKSEILHWLAQDGSWQRRFLKISIPLDYYRSGLEPVTTGYHIEFCIGVYISPFVIVILNYLGWRYLYLGLLDYRFPWKPRKEAKKQHFGNSGVWTHNLYELWAFNNFALAFGNLSAKPTELSRIPNIYRWNVLYKERLTPLMCDWYK